MGAMIEPPLGVPEMGPLLDEVRSSAAISMRSSNTIFTRARLTYRCHRQAHQGLPQLV